MTRVLREVCMVSFGGLRCDLPSRHPGPHEWDLRDRAGGWGLIGRIQWTFKHSERGKAHE